MRRQRGRFVPPPRPHPPCIRRCMMTSISVDSPSHGPRWCPSAVVGMSSDRQDSTVGFCSCVGRRTGRSANPDASTATTQARQLRCCPTAVGGGIESGNPLRSGSNSCAPRSRANRHPSRFHVIAELFSAAQAHLLESFGAVAAHIESQTPNPKPEPETLQPNPSTSNPHPKS